MTTHDEAAERTRGIESNFVCQASILVGQVVGSERTQNQSDKSRARTRFMWAYAVHTVNHHRS